MLQSVHSWLTVGVQFPKSKTFLLHWRAPLDYIKRHVWTKAGETIVYVIQKLSAENAAASAE